jgi:hypothetical protein
VTAAIYESDPNPSPDSDFVPGELRHLVTGSPGRLRDARRTPITVTAVNPDVGAFEVEVGAFEDAGARWELSLEEITRFQFARGGPVAPPETVTELENALRMFDRELVIDPDPAARQETLRRIDRARADVRIELPAPLDVAARVRARAGDPELFTLVEEFIAGRGVADLERRFTSAFVSNPRSGEFVKGHAIVLAELGLCPYHGKIVRDPGVFEGAGRKERRAEHLVARLAFMYELFSAVGEEAVTLYRGAAVEGELPERSLSSFVSATFSHDVAGAHFEGGSTTRTAVLWRQRVPIARLLMTFLETREMNGRFREAEAVLIGDPANRAF